MHITFHFCFSFPWLLKVNHIERAIRLRFSGFDQTDGAALTVGNAQSYHASYQIRSQQSQIPGSCSSPIMSHYCSLLLTKSSKQTNEITRALQLRILFDLAGTVCLSIATLVGSHDMVACVGQGCQLMTPGVPGFGKTMEEQHQWPMPCFYKMHPNTICLNKSMSNIYHAFYLPSNFIQGYPRAFQLRPLSSLWLWPHVRDRGRQPFH